MDADHVNVQVDRFNFFNVPQVKSLLCCLLVALLLNSHRGRRSSLVQIHGFAHDFLSALSSVLSRAKWLERRARTVKSASCCLASTLVRCFPLLDLFVQALFLLSITDLPSSFVDFVIQLNA